MSGNDRTTEDGRPGVDARARSGAGVPAGSVRAVVADDSQFMRASIGDMLRDNGVEVVAAASDGREAVAAVREHEPDVVTMDIEMPEVDGLEAIERIMDEAPTPVVVLSAQAEDDAEVTLEALRRGAVDYFTKPGGTVSTRLGSHEEALVETVRTAAAAEPTVADGVTGTSARADADAGTAATVDGALPESPVLVVGASTGGPPVVERVLADLPVRADLRVLVVQHMAAAFTGGFADRLDRASEYDVREAEDGDRIGGGEALVAPGGRHLVVANHARGRLRVRTTEAPPEHGVRPAVDVTLRSVADRVDGAATAAAVLTGMGEDGREGVRRLGAAGGSVVAQDEATSVVFGMPQAAIETGRVDRVLPAEGLAEGLLEELENNE